MKEPATDLKLPLVDPPGTSFFDANTGRNMRLVTAGEWKGWIVYRHPDGGWVSLRRATQDDLARINDAVSAAFHMEADGSNMKTAP